MGGAGWGGWWVRWGAWGRWWWWVECGARAGAGESSAGRRRLLGRELLSSWKKKKFCPPGLDICKQEENRKKEEADEKKKARLEREAAEAAELEELSGKVGTAQTPLEFYAPSLPLGGQPFEERGGGEWGGPPGEDG